MPKYKLTYFDMRVFAEPIRFLLHYMGKEFEDYRMPRDIWPKHKNDTPFGKLPILEVDGVVIHQTRAIINLLAKEAGLTGNNDEENLQIEMIYGAFMDLVFDISRHFKTQEPIQKEELRQEIINVTVPFYMPRFEKVLNENGGYLANKKLSWVDLFYVGYISSIPGMIGIDVTEKYPLTKELTNKVHSLQGIKEWIDIRPKTLK